MNEALDKFNAEAQQIIQSFLDTLDAEEGPETIYHYTDDAGLKGILESGKMRVTDIFNLNDPSELRYGFHPAVEIWKRRASIAPGVEQIAGLLEDFFTQGFRGAAHYFTCSFSSDGDELGQWRAYADNGRGYALGFDRRGLESAFAGDGAAGFAQTFPVCYDEKQLGVLHEQIAEKAFPLVDLMKERDLSQDEVKSFGVKLCVLLTTHHLNIALFFKHKAYRNEKEYRFLEAFAANTEPAGVKVRPRPYSLTRYREFDWKGTTGFFLTNINVGPAADHIKGMQFARDCIRMFGAPDITKITESTIPYRAF